jgi:hypothetical protein
MPLATDVLEDQQAQHHLRRRTQSAMATLGLDLSSVDAARPNLLGLAQKPSAPKRSFANHAANDAGSGISGRVTRVIVLSGMDDDRCTARMKDRVGLILVEGDRGIEHFEIEGATCRNMQVRHVAGVSRTRHYPVVRVGRIEMPACRLEARRLALAHGMDMKGMLSPRHAFERKLKQHSGGGLDERDGADILAFYVGYRHIGQYE